MNLMLRKLAMLEKNLLERAERARIQGYSTNVIESELKERVTSLINTVRVI